MNRVAVKIKEARIKSKMTEKQLAKKCGLTENYIMQIESGKKVINEKAAENILNILGEKIEFVCQQAMVEEKSPITKEAKREDKNKEVFQPIQPTEQWADALANIIRKFPIYEVNTNKIVSYKELPILNKKIEGYNWEKILFIQSPNNEMESLRIKKDDIITIYKTNEIHNNSIYLFEMNEKKMIRQLRKESNNKVSISTGTKGTDPIITELNKVKLIGKCVKVEFSLDNK